jgi:hypothetical protein
MINLLGKSLAFVHVSLSILLLGFAFAIYLNPVDFGWKEPRRFWNDQPNKKEENLLVASEFDKAEAAVRKMARFRDDDLYQLGMAQEKLAAIEPWLGKNHIKGMDLLEKLENGKGEFNIDELQFNDKDKLVLEPDAPAKLGFPQLAPVKREPAINMSFAGYVAQLRKLDGDIDKVETAMKELVNKEVAITLRLIGDTDPDGTPRRHADGSIIRPGWHYLIELEMDAQQQLKKELEYLQPLWVKELVDAQLLVGRRDLLLQRLAELGQVEGKAFLSRYDYPKMQLQKK